MKTRPGLRSKKKALRVRHVASDAKKCRNCGARFWPQRCISGKTTETLCGNIECSRQIARKL